MIARVRQSSRSYSDSEWLVNQSPTSILKQKPSQANSPTIFANLTHLVVSWELLTSLIQTGNDNVYYRVETRQGYTSTYYERTTPGLYDLDFWVQALPNSNFLYGGLYDFRVTAINQCGSGTSSPAPSFELPTYAPLFMNAPVASSVTVSLIRLTWSSITANAQTGGPNILSYELSYSEAAALSVFTVLADANKQSFDQNN